MTTIKDVARVAGVSFKTVSRVINGEPNVSSEKRERVEAAVRELNYRPTLAARQLKSQKNFSITVVMPRAAVSYVARMMVALAAACREAGYHLNTEVLDVDDGFQPIGVTRIDFGTRPDAVILIPPFSDSKPLLDWLESTGLPLVRIASVSGGYGRCLAVDDTEVAIAMVNHLIDMGHRRIAMLGPSLPEKASETRIVGYRQALEAAGIAIDPALFRRGDFSFASGVEAARHWLDLPQPPTAVFAASDDMAMGVMAETHRRGLSIPQDLAVAGFDDAPQSRLVFPALTTVYQPIARIAYAAVDLALGRDVSDPHFGHELRIRGSTNGDGKLCLEPFEF